MKLKLMVARFPYGGSEATECVDWLLQLENYCTKDPRVDEVAHWKVGDTPITMTRNAALLAAERAGCDLLLMIDSDMAPDLYMGADPAAKPFFPTALEFLLNHPGPAVVAAPYCGPPPHENVYVFRWRNKESGTANPTDSVEQYTREEAAYMGGIQEAAALPTGLILFDVRGIARMPHPRCEYEYTDRTNSRKASTEDVVLTRDMQLCGVPQYCAWDSWAGHVKRKVVGKPVPITPEVVAEKIRKAITDRQPLAGERLIDVKPGHRFPTFPPPAEADIAAKVDRVNRLLLGGAEAILRGTSAGTDLIPQSPASVAAQPTVAELNGTHV